MPDAYDRSVGNEWVLDIDVPGFDVARFAGVYDDMQVAGATAEELDKYLKYIINAKIDALENATHLPIENIKSYLDIVSANDIVVSFRDPGEFSLVRLKNGADGKTFTEKGKSSVHGRALAGFIPRNQALSKAGDDGREAAFNKKVEDRLEECRGEIAQIEQKLRNGEPIDPSVFEQNLVISKPLLSADGREVFFLSNGDGVPVREGGNPVFYLKNADGTYVREDNGEIYDARVVGSLEVVEVISYVAGVENGAIISKPIAGDHDLLSVGVKAARTDQVREEYVLENIGDPDEYSLAIAGALIVDTVGNKAVRHGVDAGGFGGIDSLDPLEMRRLNTSFVLANSKEMLAAAISSPLFETIRNYRMQGNPFPEEMGSNIFFLSNPDRPASVVVAKNEQETIDIMNAREELGYNMSVNCRYAWTRNSEGKLEVDPEKMSYQEFNKAKVVCLRRIGIGDSAEVRESKQENAKCDMDLLLDLRTLLGLVRINHPSEERQLLENTLAGRLREAEVRFFSEYGVAPPTVMAMANKDRREEVVSQIQEASKPEEVAIIKGYAVKLDEKPGQGHGRH
jgi:hypothetical protein